MYIFPGFYTSVILLISQDMNIDYLNFLEVLGTFAFAISGIRNASINNFDWFGAYVVGFITAVGGGTIRDVLLDVQPFWMATPSYLIITMMAFLSVLLFSKHVSRIPRTLFVFDAIGLGLFVVAGLEKSHEMGHSPWLSIIMGAITGCAGGVLRDLLIMQTPLIFKKDFYAMAAIIGGLIYYGCFILGLPSEVSGILASASIIAIRITAVMLKIRVPSMGKKNNDPQ